MKRKIMQKLKKVMKKAKIAQMIGRNKNIIVADTLSPVICKSCITLQKREERGKTSEI